MIDTIIHGDCLDVMKDIPDKYIDMIVIDPPYKLTAGGSKGTEVRGCTGRLNNDYMKDGKVFKYNSIKSKDWFSELYRVLKDGTHCYVMCNDKYVREYLENAEAVGFKEVNILTWAKGMHTPTQYYLKNIEFILMFRKGRAKYINNMGSFSLIDIKGLRGNKTHPSEKPVGLMEHLILNSSNENDIILDCFMGSGTTAIAARNTGRHFIGIEKEQKYVDISNSRLMEVAK